jgi:hypothetical protein
VRAFSLGKQRWDFFIIILALLTVIIFPFFVAFKPEWRKQPYIHYVFVVSYIPFLIDIIVNFRTTYVSADGEEQFEKKGIVLNYMTSHFIFDIITAVPIELL